jgi:isochorismate pyruvate lyase
MSTDKAGCAIDQVQHCTSMQDVRRNVDALDDVLVPLLVTRMGYMQQAARIKADVAHVRERTAAEGGQPDMMEAVYRHLMEECIAYEHREFARLREGGAQDGA